jgi:phosphoglycerate dehydrogenase-like enzyme
MPDDEARLLVAHENADAWRDALDGRFPDIDYRIVRSAGALAEAADFPATIAYSCVTDGFPRAAHGLLRDRAGLAWIHVGGSGFDHLAGGAGPGPLLTNGAGVLAPFLAETLLGALIALNRGFGRAIRDQARGRWSPWSFPALQGQTLAIVGTGAIGQAFAARAKALGLRVVGVNRRADPMEPFDEVRPLQALAEVAGACDYLSLNVRLVPETRHLVDAGILQSMRPTAYLLNAARGAVVDESALIAALAARRIAGAYLDVFATEPLPADSPLWRLENVLMTPHMSDRVVDWERRHARFFMDNLARWLGGERLANRVAG